MTDQQKKMLSGYRKGKKLSDETKRKISMKTKGTKMGEDNPMWKGDKIIDMHALHQWVNRNIGKAKICTECGATKNIDLANITGRYERDFTNWTYLCRKCHMGSDNRLKVFMEYAHDHSRRYKNV